MKFRGVAVPHPVNAWAGIETFKPGIPRRQYHFRWLYDRLGARSGLAEHQEHGRDFMLMHQRGIARWDVHIQHAHPAVLKNDMMHRFLAYRYLRPAAQRSCQKKNK